MDGPGIVQTLDELMTASSFDLMTFPASPATISDPRHRPSHPSPSSCWSEQPITASSFFKVNSSTVYNISYCT